MAEDDETSRDESYLQPAGLVIQSTRWFGEEVIFFVFVLVDFIDFFEHWLSTLNQ